MVLLNKIKKKYKYGLIIHYILGRLSAIGIGIHPFYLVQEGMKNNDKHVEPKINPIEARFLTPQEVKVISQHPEVGYTYQEFSNRLDSNCKCFGLLHHDQTVAYMWCNFSKIESYLSFPLKSNEVYLFDALSFKAVRGKNLAPFLRNKLYQTLKDENFNKFYSVTDKFNTPAVNFKKKLGAINLKLYIHISIFQYKKIFLLREY